MTAVEVGLELCLREPPAILKQARFGLLCNQASLDREFHYAHRLMAAAFPNQLKAIFSPQHGLFGVEQANMIESGHGFDSTLGVPIYSLYSETRKPTPEMLDGLDLFVVDLQDVGTRIYTFIWTVVHCMEACKEAEIPLLILDRPNPIGGVLIEGPVLDPAFKSFVGLAPIPMRHGLTIAELPLYCNAVLKINADVRVVPMQGWRREMSFNATGRTWCLPSPNLPRVEGVLTYPGMVLLEGTNLSEGRGTTIPFEAVGASYLDAEAYCRELEAFVLPGVVFRPVQFKPTFDKWAGEICDGVVLHVVDETAFRPYRTTVAILAAVKQLAPDAFKWRPAPYEYEETLPPIDILSGGSSLREAIDADSIQTADDLSSLGDVEESTWWNQVRGHLLY
jgi:uncharacterized protein YbbC (DUF1343 family)